MSIFYCSIINATEVVCAFFMTCYREDISLFFLLAVSFFVACLSIQGLFSTENGHHSSPSGCVGEHKEKMTQTICKHRGGITDPLSY